MSAVSQPRRVFSLALLLMVTLTLVLTSPGIVLGEGAPHNLVPGYPKYGCYDVATTGMGMWSDHTTYPMTLDVPGPVVDAYLTWIGTEDSGAPNSPDQSDLIVNDAPVVGALVDQKVTGPAEPPWYMWRANVGPSGANLISQGSNRLIISGWEGVTPAGETRRNGIALVVVYDTGTCARLNQVNLLDSMDYYWERRANAGEGTTDAFTFTFPPAPVDRDATVWLHHAGSDHVNQCREENLWAAVGGGEPPTQIVDYWATPSEGINGGKRVVENAFVPASCQSTTFKDPVTALVGWLDAWGPKPNVGGFVTREWSFVRLTVKIPAGATWLVMQGESERTGVEEVTATGESGALFGQFVIPLYNPELKISKTDGIDLAAPSDQLTYTIDYENYGYGTADNVVIIDTLPDSVSYVSATQGGVYDAATHTVKWEIGSLPVGQQGQVAVTVKLDPVFEAGTTTFTNSVAISTTTPGELDLTDNVDADSTDVFAAVELQVNKTATPDPVDAGANLTYTVDWTVGGDAYAHSVTIVDTLPSDVTFVSATDAGLYNPADHTVTWLLGEVTPVTSGSYQVTVKVKSPLYNGTQLENRVVIKDAAGNTDDASFVSTVRSDHELTLSKADSPDPVAKGAELTYMLSWGVTGNEPADNVIISDELPFGTQFVNASDGGVFDPATRAVSWNLGNKVPGDSGAVMLTVLVNQDFPNGIPIQNEATISDDKPGKETNAVEETEVIQTPEGSIGDTVWIDVNANGIQEPGEPGLGGVDLVLYDAGADGLCGTADDVELASAVTDANGKYLFDGLPAGAYCVDVGDVPAGLSLVSGHDPHGPVMLSDGQNYEDADFGYNSTLGVIGDRVWSDANGNGLQDLGEVGIAGVTLDLLSAGSDGLCGTADDAVVASTTTGPGGSYLFTGLAPGKYCVDVTDTAGKLTGAVLTGGVDPQGPIDLAAGETYLDADFGYQISACAGQIGNLVFYDANRNGLFESALGEVGIAGVTLDLVSGGAVVASVTTDANGAYLFSGLCDGAYQVIVTDLNGRLAGDYTQTYGLPNTDNNGQVSPFAVTITDGASVLYADFGYADGHLLTVSKSSNIPLGQTVEAGAEMVYTIDYSVSGHETAPNVVLRDQVPMQVEFVSATGGGVYDGVLRVVTWTLGDLAPGSSGSVTLTVRVKKPLVNNSYIFNTVVIRDDADVSDEATNIVRVHAVPILSLTKTSAPEGEVKPGDTIEYEVCYANTGNANATGVVLVDPLPLNTSYVAGSAIPAATYDEATRTLTWDIDTLVIDAPEACVSLKVTVNLIIVGLTGQANVPLSFAEWNALAITNIATLQSDQLEDLSAQVSNPLNATVKPDIYKSVNKPEVFVAEGTQATLVYTVKVTNNGTASATDVIITDEIHPKLQNPVVTATKGTTAYDPATRVWTVTVGTLAPGEIVTVTITVKTEPVAPGTRVPFSYDVTNVATVSFLEGAPRNSNAVTVRVRAVPPAEIPEPGTWLLLGSGLAGLAGYARVRVQSRRRKNS